MSVGAVPNIIEYAKQKGILRNQLAYIIATVYHETGGKMVPVRENMNYSADRILAVFGSKHSAKVTSAEAKKLARNPEALAERVYGLGNPKKARELGNTLPGDGWKYRGGGLDQRTGKYNYTRVGITDPEDVLDFDVAAKLICDDMMSGAYTGKRLDEYVTLQFSNFEPARQVINRMDQASKIAGYARSIDKTLDGMKYGHTVVVPVEEVLPEAGAVEKPIIESTRVQTWTLSGFIMSALPLIPHWLQAVLWLVGIGLVLYSIFTIPKVRDSFEEYMSSIWR